MQTSELIEKAAVAAGGSRPLADALGVSLQRLSDWRTGFRHCPPERIDQLAELAHLSMETRVRAVWEAVRKAAGKAVATLLVGVAVTTLFLSLSGQSAQLVAGSGLFRRR